MENKKEIVVKKESYDGLNKNDLKSLKTAYRSLENNMLKVSELVYKLKEQNEEELTSFCKNELGVSGATISKFYTVGKIVALEGDKIALPNSYTKIYALNKVSANIEDFNEYVNDSGKELCKMSVRDINTTVRAYLSDDIEEAEVEEAEVEEAEVEEAEVEEAEVEASIEYLIDTVNSYLNSTDAPTDVLEAFNQIITLL